MSDRYILDMDNAPSIPNITDLYMRYFGFPYQGMFVEVGAFNGKNWSFTHCLAQAGWGGLLIEPQPTEANHCRFLYDGRPDILVEQCCVGSKEDTARLYLGGSLSTMISDMIPVANRVMRCLSPNNFILVEMHRLDNLLEKHHIRIGFEVLVIDVEGAEADVLRGFSIKKWKPEMCIIEACDPCPDPLLSERTDFVRRYLHKAGYSEIVSSGFDIVFVREIK